MSGALRDDMRGPSWMYFLRKYPRQTLSMLFFLVLAGLVESVGAVSMAPLMAKILGEDIRSTMTGPLGSLLASFGGEPSLPQLLLVVALAITAKGFLTLLAFRQTGYVEVEITTQLRAELMDALLCAEWSYFTANKSGSLTYALSTESAYSGMALRSFCQVLSHLVQALTYFLAGLLVSWQVMLTSILCGALFLTLFRRLIRSVRSAGVRQADSLNAMSSFFTDSLAGAKPLKVMGLAQSFHRHIHAQSERYKAAARQTINTSGLISALQEPVFTVFLALGLYWCKTSLGMSGAMLLAMAFFFQRIFTRLSSAQQSHQQYAALEGVFLSMRHKIAEIHSFREPEGRGRKLELKHRIELKDVGFGYEGRPILSGLTLSLDIGSVTALCGPSGSGKTTVADIIVGLLRPQHGEVLADGVRLDTLDMQHWRSQVGYVPQEVFLFNDTIRNNILLGRAHSDQEVREALAKAGALDFVSATPLGLDSLVGEQGRMFSGGQRQRLMIARALLARPKLLILDEATSGQDQDTQSTLLNTISALKRDMAVLAISHSDEVLGIADSVHHIGQAPH